MSYIAHLKCRQCGRTYKIEPIAACEECWAPLEVVYDYDRIRAEVPRQTVESRPPTMWRYRELLPLANAPWVGRSTGFTPLLPAPRLASALGAREVYLKNDAVNYPTLSFKDRVVAVALSKAREFGFETVGCSSTGNLANSVAAQAAAGGFKTFIFVPADLEPEKLINTRIYGATLVKVRGNYDQVNRLCSEVSQKYAWGMVNVNLRSYYSEGSKTFGYEIAEQLGWRVPQNIVVPMAGGSLITKINKAFGELQKLGWIELAATKFFGAQATGCSPITTAARNGTYEITPQKPNTLVKSLAIGNPADGFYAAKMILESGGTGDDVSDAEVVEGIRLLAETEGLFAETAGGVTVAVARKLIRLGRLNPKESIVLAITGNGLKTVGAVSGELKEAEVIRPRLAEFEELYLNVPAAAGAWPATSLTDPISRARAL
ncbi:MAG: threonine synthase [Acidobacteria bacterium]|nr:threonine synthase [Acidobacteriota bacterium]